MLMKLTPGSGIVDVLLLLLLHLLLLLLGFHRES